MLDLTDRGFGTLLPITPTVHLPLRPSLSDSETLRVSSQPLSLASKSSCLDANLFKQAFEDAQASNAKSAGGEAAAPVATEDAAAPEPVNVSSEGQQDRREADHQETSEAAEKEEAKEEKAAA